MSAFVAFLNLTVPRNGSCRYKNEITKEDKLNLDQLIQYQKHHLVRHWSCSISFGS